MPLKAMEASRTGGAAPSPDHSMVDSVTLDTNALATFLCNCSVEYNGLPEKLRRRCSWAELVKRLNDKDGHYLKLVHKMCDFDPVTCAHGPVGELVFIDKDGNPVFKSRGVEPIRKEVGFMPIFKWFLESSHPGDRGSGLEFPYDEKEIREIEEVTGKPFVASKSGGELRASYMRLGRYDSGDVVRLAMYCPDKRRVYMSKVEIPGLEEGYESFGVVPLLRVRKFAS
jgi:hypothetical protein